jgi:hypothetical protein
VTESIPTTQTDAGIIKQVKKESVASILEREGEITIRNWFEMVEQSAELTCIPLSRHERTGHLPRLLRDLIRRMRLDRGLAKLQFPWQLATIARYGGNKATPRPWW